MGYLEGWNSKEELVAHLTKDYHAGENDGQPLITRLLGQSLRGNHLWTAWESGNDVTNGKPTTFIVVFLLGSNRYNGGAWGYKPVSEDMGPCEVDCPLYLLKLAHNPPDGKYSREWREKVLEAKSHDKNVRSQIKDGIFVRFSRAFDFRSAGTHSQFKVQDAKRGLFLTSDDRLVRLGKKLVSSTPFTILPAFE